MEETELERSWTTVSRTASYDGRVKLFSHIVELPDATVISYEVDESIAFAVATLVIDDDAVLLARQYRYPINQWILDLPGGAGHIGETPETAARRELEEELGLLPRDLRLLHTFYVNPGRSAWPVHVFVCTSTTASGRVDRSVPAEQVHPVRVPVFELDTGIAAGQIVDPTLIVARATAALQGYLPPVAAR